MTKITILSGHLFLERIPNTELQPWIFLLNGFIIVQSIIDSPPDSWSTPPSILSLFLARASKGTSLYVSLYPITAGTPNTFVAFRDPLKVKYIKMFPIYLFTNIILNFENFWEFFLAEENCYNLPNFLDTLDFFS